MVQQPAPWASLEQEVNHELERILQFWIQHVKDNEKGGFYGEIDNDMTIHKDSPKGLVLNARILWTYAKAYRSNPKPEYLEMADRAYAYLMKYFWDPDNGGYYWLVDSDGKPSVPRKQIYGQAFVLYALSEYYPIVEKAEILDKAEEIFNLLEKYSYDPKNKGYFEAYTSDWKLEEDLRLSILDMNEKKSMNTHLHILEAYTNFYRIWKSEQLRDKLSELIDITVKYIIDDQSHSFILFFDEDWSVRSDHISFGHDIEGSWLLFEAAEVLGDEQKIKAVRQIALDMAEAVYQHGVDTDGGVLNEANAEEVFDTDKHWWPQAEAVVGFLNAYQLSGEQHYLNASLKAWDFITKYIVDHEHGEWFWKVTRDGKPYMDAPKVDPWKCPYHNSRACFEVLERIHQITK